MRHPRIIYQVKANAAGVCLTNLAFDVPDAVKRQALRQALCSLTKACRLAHVPLGELVDATEAAGLREMLAPASAPAPAGQAPAGREQQPRAAGEQEADHAHQ